MRVETFEEPPRPVGVSMEEFEQWVCSEMFLGATYAEALREAIDRNHPDRVLMDGMCYNAQVRSPRIWDPVRCVVALPADAAETRAGLENLDRGANLAAHNAHRSERGLGEVESVQDTLLDADWFLALAYEMLDSSRRREWPNLHYVGAPCHGRPTSTSSPRPATHRSCSSGSARPPTGQAAVLQRVVDALATLDVRVLVTLGAVRPDKLDLPANAITAEFVPHDQVLPDAALLVSHVGHGTMCAAARHGVPILAMPMGRDQDCNAEILSDIGIGSWLPPSSTSSEIAEVAQRLLGDEPTRHRCADVAAAISAHGRLDHAIRLVADPLG